MVVLVGIVANLVLVLIFWVIQSPLIVIPIVFLVLALISELDILWRKKKLIQYYRKSAKLNAKWLLPEDEFWRAWWERNL